MGGGGAKCRIGPLFANLPRLDLFPLRGERTIKTLLSYILFVQKYTV